METTFQNLEVQAAYQKLKELEQQKVDMVAAAGSMYLMDNKLCLDGINYSIGKGNHAKMHKGDVKLDISEVAFSQINSKFSIPIRYARLCKENVDQLWELNVNKWLRNSDKNFFIRSYMKEDGTGTLRAFLSDRYSPFENIMLATTALKKVQEHIKTTGQKIIVERCDLSDKKLYMRFTAPDIKQDAFDALTNYVNPETRQGGKDVAVGFIISNSEVGHGRTTVAPRIIIGACKNGLTWMDEAMHKTHLGAKLDEGNFAWSEQTIAANALLISNQVKDALDKFLSPDFLGQKIAAIEEMHARKLEHPVQACKNISRLIGLNEEEADSVVNFFAKQGSNESVWDVAQALTYYAHKADAEKAYDIERMAPGILTLAKQADVKEDVKVRATSEAEYEEASLN